MDDSLEKIKEAESRAVNIIGDATQEKEKILADARKKVMDTLNLLESKSKEERDMLLEKQKGEMEEEKQAVLEDASRSIKSMRATAKSKLPKEADFLFEKFLEAAS